MGLWTDIRDAVTSPFRAVGSFAQDIAQGKNFFESLGTFATRSFFALNPMIAVNAPLINNTPAKDVLANDTFNALTAGLGQNIVDVNSFAQKSNTGIDFSFEEARDAYFAFAKGTAKVGAAVLSAGAAPAGAASYTVGAAAYTGANATNAIFNKIDDGDILGAISSAAPYTGIELPDSVKDAVNAGTEIKNAAQAAAAALAEAKRQAQLAAQSGSDAQGLVDLTKSNLPLIERGYSSSIPGVSGSNTSSTLPLIIAGGALALILLKGKR